MFKLFKLFVSTKVYVLDISQCRACSFAGVLMPREACLIYVRFLLKSCSIVAIKH